MRLIDAKQLEKQVKEAFETQNPVLMGQMLRWIRKQKTIDAVPVVRCRECKNYVIVDEFEGGKRYMCLVNHFSYLDNDGDNQFCSYGEEEGADNEP